MSQLADQMRYDAVATVGCPAHIGSAALPRSFSAGGGSANSRSDYSELIRAASVRDHLGSKSVSQKQGKGKVRGGAGKVPRSYSVGLGRIEEEKSGELGEDYTSIGSGAFHRSRSCAVSAAGGVLAGIRTGKFQKPVAIATALA
ncbi:unnamed protein product [Linum tenue]|uniref:Uncharacterized protein n=1 Tax=Linum tenue TaxID=586396 RepID=A0AAV0J868_9ROSI|nr:unnamed protein product [Linum tenue]